MTTLVEILSDHLQDLEDRQVGLLRSLVETESPSQDAASQEAVFDIIERELAELDYKILRMPGQRTGGYLIAYPAGRTRHQPRQLLIGHCDTVWPLGSIDNMPWSDNGSEIHGPGVYDMKAGITQMIYALKAIEASGQKPDLTPVILINSDEEIGSRESGTAIRRLARIVDRAFIMEPPLGSEGKLKTARKGIGRFTITVRGTAAHAGLDPGKGHSAIVELSHQIQRLFAMNDPDKGITVNVGMIEGGLSANVVAPESKAVVDVRVLTHSDGETITRKIKALKPVNQDVILEVSGYIGRPPMERTSRNRKLWQMALQAADAMNIDLQESTAGGGSDGNTTSLYTATLDGLGTTGDGAHAAHEHISSGKLSERTLLLALLIMAPCINDDG